MDKSIIETIKMAKIIAVLIIEEKRHVRPLIESLLEGGVNAIELTLRTKIAPEAIDIISSEYPEILCGVGTILTPEQTLLAKESGASFGVSPGLNRRVIEAARENNLPFFPGVSTPSDIEAALEYDYRLLKFFPAEPMGGIPYLKSINAPYKHLGISYLPLGGVSADNLHSYLKEDIIGGVGGSWIASPKLISDENWGQIVNNAKEAIAITKK